MEPEILIDAQSGAIMIGEAHQLGGGAGIEETAAALGAFVRLRHDLGNGYEWLYLHGLRFGEHPAHLSLCFQRGRLDMANFSISLPGAGPDWPTGAEIDAEIVFVREVLASMIGFDPAERSKVFPWGSVWSDYDPKAGIASNGLRYTL